MSLVCGNLRPLIVLAYALMLSLMSDIRKIRNGGVYFVFVLIGEARKNFESRQISI